MELQHIFSYLVPPGRPEEVPDDVRGTAVPLRGSLYSMLCDVFNKSDRECNIPVRFLPAEDGTQHNQVRALLLDLIGRPTLARARHLALELHSATGSISGLGLLFFLLGRVGADHKALVSRFPANQGVLAETRRDSLEIEFVEKVFMKNAATYKAATYRDRSLQAGFWTGSVVDKQMSFAPHSFADYWVRRFLRSELRVTGKAGSRRLAIALREAAKAVQSLDAKHELASIVALIPRLGGRLISSRGVLEHFNVSNQVADAVESRLHSHAVLGEMFELDADEFRTHAAYRTVELNTGGVLSAPAEQFDDVFTQETVDADSRTVKFVAEGQVVDERIRKQK